MIGLPWAHTLVHQYLCYDTSCWAFDGLMCVCLCRSCGCHLINAGTSPRSTSCAQKSQPPSSLCLWCLCSLLPIEGTFISGLLIDIDVFLSTNCRHDMNPRHTVLLWRLSMPDCISKPLTEHRTESSRRTGGLTFESWHFCLPVKREVFSWKDEQDKKLTILLR